MGLCNTQIPNGFKKDCHIATWGTTDRRKAALRAHLRPCGGLPTEGRLLYGHTSSHVGDYRPKVRNMDNLSLILPNTFRDSGCGSYPEYRRYSWAPPAAAARCSRATPASAAPQGTAPSQKLARSLQLRHAGGGRRRRGCCRRRASCCRMGITYV